MNRTLTLALLFGFLTAGGMTAAKAQATAVLLPAAAAEHAVEKIHLHLDKPYYAAGQTIWFKAYVVDAANQPSLLSRILYVELIDEKNAGTH